MPTDVVAVLLGMRHTRSAAQLLLRLRTAGLADYKTVSPGPLVGSRVVRLWTLTPAGQTIVPAQRLAEPSAEGRSHLPYGQPARWRDVARQRDVPLLVVAYRLLACVVRELDLPVRVVAWEHPWIRTVSQTGTGRTRHVRLPAAATLIQDNSGGEQLARPAPVAGPRHHPGGQLPAGAARIDRTDSHVGCQCKRRTATGCGCRRRRPLTQVLEWRPGMPFFSRWRSAPETNRCAPECSPGLRG